MIKIKQRILLYLLLSIVCFPLGFATLHAQDTVCGVHMNNSIQAQSLQNEIEQFIASGYSPINRIITIPVYLGVMDHSMTPA